MSRKINISFKGTEHFYRDPPAAFKAALDFQNRLPERVRDLLTGIVLLDGTVPNKSWLYCKQYKLIFALPTAEGGKETHIYVAFSANEFTSFTQVEEAKFREGYIDWDWNKRQPENTGWLADDYELQSHILYEAVEQWLPLLGRRYSAKAEEMSQLSTVMFAERTRTE